MSPAKSKSTDSHLVFQDIVTADIVKSNFSLDEQVLEILNLSDEFTKTINQLEKDEDKDS